MTELQEFSAGYYIAPDVAVETFSGENAAVPLDLYEQLQYVVGSPVYGAIAGFRFELSPEHGIPGDTVAIPSDVCTDNDDVLLIERPHQGGVFF